MTLYMKIGGRKAVEKAMPSLNARLEADPCFDLAAFGAEFSPSGDLCEFLVFLFGGAPYYDGKPVSDLLAPLCTCTDAYQRFVDHLVVVFNKSSTPVEDEHELRRLMGRLRPSVLAPKPSAPILVYSVETGMMRA